MKGHGLGIAIIVGIIFIAIITGGDIFRGNPVGVSPISDAERTTSTNRTSISSNKKTEPVATSVYAKKVFLSSVNEPGSFNEYFEIGNSLRDGERVIITGWKIKSTVTGNEITIPGAAVIANIGVQDQTVVSIESGDVVYVNLGTSPIGTSFRLNSCTGFFEERNNFEPSLPVRCPDINYAPSLSNTYNNVCLDYIERFPTCKVPRERDFPEPDEDGNYYGPKLSSACKNWLTSQVSYQSCVTHNITEPNFLKPEYRLYANYRGIMTLEKRDTLVLIDNLGQIVDSYSY